MNLRIVDMRRSFPLSETFPKLQKKVIWISFAKDTGGFTSCHVNIYQLPRVSFLLKVPLLAFFEKRCPAYLVLFCVLEYGAVVNSVSATEWCEL